MSPFVNPVYIISILIALSVHECAHAFVADRLGDPTARHLGRLTLNPIAHIDPIGALLFLTVGFGWGKPVPVDPRHFRNHRRDTALTALAGPFSNFILAFVAFVAIRIFFPTMLGAQPLAVIGLAIGRTGAVSTIVSQILMSSVFVNLGLMAFNLLPIAPLDGSKIIHPFIPLRYEDLYEEFLRRGIFILIGLLLAENLLHFPLLITWITWIVQWALRLMAVVTGVQI